MHLVISDLQADVGPEIVSYPPSPHPSLNQFIVHRQKERTVNQLAKGLAGQWTMNYEQ